MNIQNLALSPVVGRTNINQIVDIKKEERMKKVKNEFHKFISSYESKVDNKNDPPNKFPDRVLRVIKFEGELTFQHRLGEAGGLVNKIEASYIVYLMSVNKNTNEFLQVE